MRLFVALMLLTFVQPPVHAEEPAQPKTTLQVYHVGDLVGAEAMVAESPFTQLTPEQWHQEYPETLQALKELQDLVEAMCPEPSSAVKAYTPNLSLVVRHTSEGHRQVSELLKLLRADNDSAAVTLEIRSVTPSWRNSTNQSEEDATFAAQCFTKQKLTPEEAEKLQQLMPLQPSSELGPTRFTVHLESGRRMPWGIKLAPCTVMACVRPGSSTAQLRIDYIADTDEVRKEIPVGTALFTLADGESSVFQQHCSGETIFWLVTAHVKQPAADNQVAAAQHR